MTKIREIWKQIPGYEGYYEVSNFGNVRSLPRNTIKNYSTGAKVITALKGRLKPSSNCNNGYLRIGLCKNDVPKTFSVHRLVMSAFIGDSDLHVDHKNGIKTDNRLSNLQYLNVRDNICKNYPISETGYRGVHKEHTYFYMLCIKGKKYKKRGFKTAKQAFEARLNLMKEKGISISKYTV